MYNELYRVWKSEKESSEIQLLPKSFYFKLTQYTLKIKEESRMLDQKTTRAKLLIRESKNVKNMAKELVSIRYKKIIDKMLAAELVSKEGLTSEEEKLLEGVLPSFEFFPTVLRNILSGRLQQFERIESKKSEKPKTRILRFLKGFPAIVGVDMKTYGPFKPEDVASLPAENAGILIKQGVAVEIEVKST